MFEPTQVPRVFGLPPGADFARELVTGLKHRLKDQPPDAMARIDLILNTRRMQRRVEAVFAEGEPGFLPKIRLITELGAPADLARLPKPVPALRRKLELAELVKRLIEADPKVAPKAATYDLADSLAALMDEMKAEGVSPAVIAGLDVSDQSGHWERALRFLNIVTKYDAQEAKPDAAEINRQVLDAMLSRWNHSPPTHPVIFAGSTGSRASAFQLMIAVSRLPQGAVILPGFDHDMPKSVWRVLRNNIANTEAMQGEDHPQFRFARLLHKLALPHTAIKRWTDAEAPNPARNAMVSLAMRPAPVTDQWLTDGPNLPPLGDATASLTLVEAASPREEARAIALRLRKAAEDGETAALITPDRMLTRRVSAVLDQWNILPDDSAGTPAHLTAPGRLLRQVAALSASDVTADALLAILKHPLCHTGADRGQHLLWTTELELFIRETGMPFPDLKQLSKWKKAEEAADWIAWIDANILRVPLAKNLQLSAVLETHLEKASAICAGSNSDDASELWAKEAGRTCKKILDELFESAGSGSVMTAQDYAGLIDSLLRSGEVRDRDAPHPQILIWGTIEARVMGADLLILGGLNEHSWPNTPPADPWLNRAMRQKAGLLLPERRIGLSAHDFQQAICAKEVWLTRAKRSEDAETVPSRWLNRLTNLLQGLRQSDGPQMLEEMRQRGEKWLMLAKAQETPIETSPAPRPSPAPPVASRPDRLSVTNIEKLIRDPYAIYASKVLRLYPLKPVQHAPDAINRGIAIHGIFEEFVSDTAENAEHVTVENLLSTARTILHDTVPWHADRLQWLVRIEKIAEWFVAQEMARRADARPVMFEETGGMDLTNPPFRISAKADRIDVTNLGEARVYDYKTGHAPTENEQKSFSIQLLATAAIIGAHGFTGLSPRRVSDAVYISLGSGGKEVRAPLGDCPPEKTLAMLQKLLMAYTDPAQGYTARNRMHKDVYGSDYDQLSRYGEWDASDAAVRVILR